MVWRLAKEIELTAEAQESIYVVFLNNKNKITGYSHVSKGGMVATHISPMDILRPAIMHQCISMILIHNHPSGDPTPSPDDLTTTQKIKKASQIVGLTLLDHIIVSQETYYSFADNDVL
jgi:DNA repair protein RadC